MSGYTEAELAAAAFSKQFKDASNAFDPSSSGSYKHRRHRDQSPSKEYEYRRNSQSSSGIHRRSPHRENQDQRYKEYDGNRDWEFESSRSEVIGRDRCLQSYSNRRTETVTAIRSSRVEQQRRSKSREREKSGNARNSYRDRSRSRSRSRSGERKRKDRSRSRSRSRSRETDRRDPDEFWIHDKYRELIVVGRSPSRSPSRVPNDYRPPSPTWVSRAGGVAIMRKKKQPAT